MQNINGLQLIQYQALENKILLTPELLSRNDFNINLVRLILETGQVVSLLDNYKSELFKFKNNQPRRDMAWLTLYNGSLVFTTRNAIILPLIIEESTVQSSSSQNSNIKEVCIFILDTSGSMGEGRGYNPDATNVGKLGAAKKIIRDLVTKFPDTEYKVLPFDQTFMGEMTQNMGQSTRYSENQSKPWYETRPREEFNTYIDNIRASGGTPLFYKTAEGVNKAVEIAESFEKEKKIYKVSVIILTDGQASDGERECMQARSEIAKLMSINRDGSPKFSSDIIYYYADGEGGKQSGLLMEIPEEKMISFHNNEGGIRNAGSELYNRMSEDRTRMTGVDFNNFRSAARR